MVRWLVGWLVGWGWLVGFVVDMDRGFRRIIPIRSFGHSGSSHFGSGLVAEQPLTDSKTPLPDGLPWASPSMANVPALLASAPASHHDCPWPPLPLLRCPLSPSSPRVGPVVGSHAVGIHRPSSPPAFRHPPTVWSSHRSEHARALHLTFHGKCPCPPPCVSLSLS